MMGDTRDELPEAPVAPPKKKSLFSKPTFSKPQELEEGIDFFSRAKELYPRRLAEEERRRQRKLVKLERKRSTASAERKASSTPEIKRRRVSAEPEDKNEHSSDSSPNNDLQDEVYSSRGESTLSTPGPKSKSKSESDSQQRLQASPTTLSARYGRDLETKNQKISKEKPIAKGYISLSDSEDEGVTVKQSVPDPFSVDDDDDIYMVPSAKPSPEEEESRLSDEEFPELIQRAREKEKKKELERLNTQKSFAEQNHGTGGRLSAADDVFREPKAPEADPVVEILVSSCLEGTKPLMVRRKLTQRLKEVRLSWCDKQVIGGQYLPPEIKASIFLTWNGKRLFDASTCKHLGIKVGSNGKLSSEGKGIDEHGRLHFEAWTEDAFMAYQQQQQLQQERGGREDEPEQEEEVAVERVKLIMKAKDMEPFRMRVKATTLIQKMVDAFCLERNIPEGKDVALYFDGDKLDPASKIEDTELADMDTVEVHIR